MKLLVPTVWLLAFALSLGVWAVVIYIWSHYTRG